MFTENNIFLLKFILTLIAMDFAEAANFNFQPPANSKYPCAFIDTVNITGSYPHDRNNNRTSYVYNDTVIPPQLISLYDFIIEDGVRVPMEEPHLRACVCKARPCIRFCCEQGFYYDLRNKLCVPMNAMSPSAAATSIPSAVDQSQMEVKFSNGSTLHVNTSEHFFVFKGLPCDVMKPQFKDNRPVTWSLYENGTIVYRKTLFSKHYCYSPMPEFVERLGDNFGSGEIRWHWQPLVCVPEKLPFVLGVKEWTYVICLIITVICMIIILFIYLLCSEMRNTFYGVAIKSYTLCIIIGYSLLAHLTLTNPADMSKYACSKIPIFALMYLILSFYILSFISFNFYLSFFGIILSKLLFWIIFFPIVVVAACWSFFVSYDYYNNKPVFGTDTCWFDPRNCSIVVYLYAPIILACIFSGIFYMLSLVRMNEAPDISDVNKLIAKVSRNRFKSFWKFVGYTLLSWLVCMCSFAINYYRGEKTHINYVVCLFIAFHGFGSLYALIGKNQQIQHFLRKIDEDMDCEDITDVSVPMTSF